MDLFYHDLLRSEYDGEYDENRNKIIIKQMLPNLVHERKMESGMVMILLFLQLRVRNSDNSHISDGNPVNILSDRFNTIRFLQAPMLDGRDVRLLQSR